MPAAKFELEIGGLELPSEALRAISEELQKTLEREIGKLDLKGEIAPSPELVRGSSHSKTAGMVYRYRSSS